MKISKTKQIFPFFQASFSNFTKKKTKQTKATNSSKTIHIANQLNVDITNKQITTKNRLWNAENEEKEK